MGLVSPQLGDNGGAGKNKEGTYHNQCHPGPGNPVEGREEAGHHEGDAEEGCREGAPEGGQNAGGHGFGLGEDHLRECWLGLRQKKGAKGQAQKSHVLVAHWVSCPSWFRAR
jgi:hypothetical protein